MLPSAKGYGLHNTQGGGEEEACAVSQPTCLLAECDIAARLSVGGPWFWNGPVVPHLRQWR